MKSYIAAVLNAACAELSCKPASGKCPAEVCKTTRHFGHFNAWLLQTSCSVRYISFRGTFATSPS